jgi:hypothetical protein
MDQEATTSDYLPSQTLEPDLGVLDRLAILRQHEILSRVGEALLAQPSGMRLGPCIYDR